MSDLVMSRRAILEYAAAGAAAMAAAGIPAATLAGAAPAPEGAISSGMIAAWVRLRPEAGAEVRLAYLDAGRRLVRELPEVKLVGSETVGAPAASVWGQAQQAGALAQMLAAAALAGAWAVPLRECEIRPGCIAHPLSGRSTPHRVWIDIV